MSIIVHEIYINAPIPPSQVEALNHITETKFENCVLGIEAKRRRQARRSARRHAPRIIVLSSVRLRKRCFNETIQVAAQERAGQNWIIQWSKSEHLRVNSYPADVGDSPGDQSRISHRPWVLSDSEWVTVSEWPWVSDSEWVFRPKSSESTQHCGVVWTIQSTRSHFGGVMALRFPFECFWQHCGER